jgi:siroheme synthase (precorrin-2 oxidase/ferrochelatase)
MSEERIPPIPPEERMLRWFVYEHLPPQYQEVSQLFASLAHKLVARLKPGPERTVMLRKLLEAKDAAVRQQIDDTDAGQ